MSHEIHVDQHELLRFRSGKAAPATARAVVSHLLSGCQECRKRAAEAWGQQGMQPEVTVSSNAVAAVSRVAKKVATKRDQLADEKREALGLVEDLLKQPPLRRWMVVRNSARYRTFAVVDALLTASQQQVFNSPQDGIETAQLAKTLQEAIDPATYGSGPLADLGARVYGCLAHAQRAASRLTESEASLERAQTLLEEGTGDPLEEAQVLYFKALLLLAQRHFALALRTVDRALSRYRRFGSHIKVARALVGKAAIQGRTGDFEKAIRTLQRSIAMFQPEEDLRLALAARHNLVFNFTNAGRTEEALASLSETLPLYHQLGDKVSLLKLQWLEGRLLHQIGRAEEALASLEASRSGLIDAEIPYEAAVVAFNIAAIRAERGETGEVKRLAAEMLKVFQALHIEREAMAAWILFREAAEAEAVTATLLAELATYFEKAAKQPGLKFRT